MVDKEEFLNLVFKQDVETIKNKYRFKTLEEFETEYGSSWRNNAGDFAPKMDYLLGRSLGDFEIYNFDSSYDYVFRLSCPTTCNTRGFWYINWKMLTNNEEDVKALNKKIVEDKDVSKCMFKIVID